MINWSNKPLSSICSIVTGVFCFSQPLVLKSHMAPWLPPVSKSIYVMNSSFSVRDFNVKYTHRISLCWLYHHHNITISQYRQYLHIMIVVWGKFWFGLITHFTYVNNCPLYVGMDVKQYIQQGVAESQKFMTTNSGVIEDSNNHPPVEELLTKQLLRDRQKWKCCCRQ